MASPATKRFAKKYQPIFDTIASLDLDQETREEIAEALGDALDKAGDKDFRRDTFVLLASDPLVACSGYHDDAGVPVPCPHGRVIRIAMHLSDAPDGRSAAWSQRRPEIRCVSCGATEFSADYRENVLARPKEQT